jgi:hypothetical protein
MKVDLPHICGADSNPAEQSADVMRHDYQVSTNGAKAVAAQQIQSQGAQ